MKTKQILTAGAIALSMILTGCSASSTGTKDTKTTEVAKKKAVKTTPCGGCPYGKHVPCIGYCIARLHSEMKGKKGRG